MQAWDELLSVLYTICSLVVLDSLSQYLLCEDEHVIFQSAGIIELRITYL